MTDTQLTEEQFLRVMPKRAKKKINPTIVANINKLLADPDLRDSYRENLLSYTNVMANGTFKIESYIDAVRYVTHKLMGDTNVSAFVKTFPDRYQKFLTNGTKESDIRSYISSYNKNKLVNLIYEQTLVPSHVLNADLHQAALNVQADLMVNASSEKVRTDAANSLLTHLKRPEAAKLEIDVNLKEDSSINALRESTMELVRQQKLAIEAGQSSPKDIAHSKLAIEGDVIEGETVQ